MALRKREQGASRNLACAPADPLKQGKPTKAARFRGEMRWFKQILAFLSLSVIAIPALAETDHLKRSVVRVVTLAQTADGVVVVGHGTGFAVSPSDIVTNAHVVEDYLQLKAQGTPAALWVIPARGGKPLDASVKAFDRDGNDLAVVNIGEATIPRATLYGGSISGDLEAAALGYPETSIARAALARTAP
jgi:S1-C subfamily serine protease